MAHGCGLAYDRCLTCSAGAICAQLIRGATYIPLRRTTMSEHAAPEFVAPEEKAPESVATEEKPPCANHHYCKSPATQACYCGAAVCEECQWSAITVWVPGSDTAQFNRCSACLMLSCSNCLTACRTCALEPGAALQTLCRRKCGGFLRECQEHDWYVCPQHAAEDEPCRPCADNAKKAAPI